MKARLTIPLLFFAALAGPGCAAQPLKPAPAQPSKPAVVPQKILDPRTAALLAWAEPIFPWGPGETTIDEVTAIPVPGWRLYRLERKYKADEKMGDATFLAIDDRGQVGISGDAFADPARVRAKVPVRSDADLDPMREQLKRFFRGPFRVVLDPMRDRLPTWKGVSVKLDTGYGEYEVNGFLKADDGGLLLLGRAWDRGRSITAQRLEMLNVKDTPSEGPDNARVTVVEFSDMQCGYCKRRSADWEPLLSKLGGQLTVKRYYKFFPLTSEHQWAFRAASAGYCLFGERGSNVFLKFKKSVYGQQEQLTVAGIDLFSLDYARANDIPESGFKSCYLGDRSVKKILGDLTEGFALRVRATPTYFIDGVPVSWFYDDLMEEYLRRTYLKGAGLPLPTRPATPVPAGTHK